MNIKRTFTLLLCIIIGEVTLSANHTTGNRHNRHNRHNHEHSSCVNDTLDPIQEAILHEIVVSGLTGLQRMQDAAAPFSVITPSTLHQSFGTSIADAVGHQPGLSQISTGTGISKPVIRGLGYNRVVVVDNGIRQESQQWGDEHGLEVSADGIHSVEILKGPASLMYGSDAIAGVMILHPEPALEDGIRHIRLGSEYQSNQGLYACHATLAGNRNGFLWNWTVADKAAHCYQNDRDGYVPGSWFRQWDIQGMLGINRNWGHSWLRFSHGDFTPGIVEGERNEVTGRLEYADGASAKSYHSQLPFQRVLHPKAVSDNAWRLGEGQLKAIIGYQRNYRREFEDSKSEAELALKLHTLNYDIRYQTPAAGWKLATGLNGMYQENVNEGEEFLIPDYRLLDVGLFATAGRQWNRWHLSGGIRADRRVLTSDELTEEDGTLRFTAFDKQFTGITGSLGAVWNLTESANLRLNWARGFRAPTISELASNGVHEGSIQYEIGNRNLKSEYSRQIDLGFDYTARQISIQAALFVNSIDNYIFLSKVAGVLTDGYQTYQYAQGDARLLGGEITLDVHPIKALHVSNSLRWVESRQLHRHDAGKYLPMIPAPRWDLNLHYNFRDFAHGHCRRPFAGISMEYNFRQDHYYGVDDTETATPDYGIVSLSCGMDVHLWGHNCLELTLACQNLFDKVYQPHTSRLKYADVNAVTGRQGVSAPGRNICLKVNFPIEF